MSAGIFILALLQAGLCGISVHHQKYGWAAFAAITAILAGIESAAA